MCTTDKQIRFYFSPYAIGAVEKRWYECGEEFEKMGHEVLYIAKRPDADVESDKRVTYIKGYSRSSHGMYDKTWREFAYAVRALRAVRQCDVLVMNSIFTPILCPLIRNKYKVSVYNVARMPKKQMSLYNVDMLSCVSNATRNVLLKQSPRLANKSCVINNPVNTLNFIYSKRTCSNAPSVVYSGRIHPEKGIDILVKSIEVLRQQGMDVKLTLVGPDSRGQGGGGSEYIEYLKSFAKSFTIAHVPAIRDPKQLAAELSKHDIYCYPSMAEQGETFGIAPLEAMALGIPTIVSRLSCFKDFTEDKKSALVFDHRSEGCVEELASLIKQLATDSLLYDTISLNGAEAAKEISNKKIAAKYISMFQQLLNNKK